jgi:WD40 repeat protein
METKNEVLCCYAHEDQKFLHELRKHLKVLERRGLITQWSAIDIGPGENWSEEINKHLNTAKFILLLISADFIESDYCYSIMTRAMQRHEDGDARVIPIILRPISWEGTPFAQLPALPKDAKPVISWEHQDDAFAYITNHIRAVLEGSDRAQEVSTEEQHKQSRVSEMDLSSQPDLLPRPAPRVSRRYAVMALVGLGLVATGGVYLISSRSTLGIQTLTGRILYHTVSPNFVVNNVIWSPNGDYLATVDGDHTVSVLDATNGTRLITYRKHSKNVNAAVWSPNGKEIASASSDGTVQIWNAKSGNTRLVYQAPASVWIVDWSPNGKYVASAGASKTTQVWDADTGKLVTTCQGLTDGIWATAWSHDGKRIASGYTDGTVQICSAADGHQLLTYHGQFGDIYEVMWSHHHDTILSASKDHTVHVWNATNGTLHLAYSGHSASVRAAEWSPDDTFIVSGDTLHVIQIWDATTGKTLYTCRGHTDEVGSVTWSPNGKQIASGSNDGTIRIWDV